MAESVKAMNWREQLRKNAARTRWVIAIFILLYLCVGLLIDMVIHASGVSALVTSGMQQAGSFNAFQVYQPSLSQIFMALITFKIVPYATLIMGAVAVVSLYVTYHFYDKLMLLGTEYVEVNAQSTDPVAQQLFHLVEEMKIAAGMRYMPKVFIIEAGYMNAFASGYSEKSAMIAVTRGLLDVLDRAELQAVVAHELSHIRHGDIKLTLTASVLSNIMLMAIDVLFYRFMFSRDNDNRGNALMLVVVVARFVLPLVTVLLMLYLSRTREYMADAGSVELMRDNEPMIRALKKIHNNHQEKAEEQGAAYANTPHEAIRRASYIYDPVLMGVRPKHCPSDWFSTHPGMKKRLAALGLLQMDKG